MVSTIKMKAINNPETMTTGTEDLSSGASNRSKTTMGTDSDYHLFTTQQQNVAQQPVQEKIQIKIDFCSQKESKEKKKRREKADNKH